MCSNDMIASLLGAGALVGSDEGMATCQKNDGYTERDVYRHKYEGTRM